jgi:hypothetical protein
MNGGRIQARIQPVRAVPSMLGRPLIDAGEHPCDPDEGDKPADVGDSALDWHRVTDTEPLSANCVIVSIEVDLSGCDGILSGQRPSETSPEAERLYREQSEGLAVA